MEFVWGIVLFSVRIFFVNLDQIQSMAIEDNWAEWFEEDDERRGKGQSYDNDDDANDGDGNDDDDDDDDDCVGERLRIKPLRRFVCRGHWYGPASSQAGGGTLH